MKDICAGLKKYTAVSEAEIPCITGFYAFYTLTNSCFSDTQLSKIGQFDCIYIGIAADETLNDRVLGSHLVDTGKSTFRRSLSAILRNKLDLTPVMRGSTATRSNISHYKLDLGGEQKLTAFMHDNLAIATYPHDTLGGPLETIEKKLIEIIGYPAFNLEYSKAAYKPYYSIIKDARRECQRLLAENK